MENTKTLDTSSIKALISLLDDPGEIVYNEVHQTLISLGSKGIPLLQTAFDEGNSDLLKERIAEILDKLKIEKLEEDLKTWKELHEQDLLLIEKYTAEE